MEKRRSGVSAEFQRVSSSGRFRLPRLNQTERELLDCAKRLRPSSQIITETEGPRNQDEREQLSPQRLQIT